MFSQEVFNISDSSPDKSILSEDENIFEDDSFVTPKKKQKKSSSFVVDSSLVFTNYQSLFRWAKDHSWKYSHHSGNYCPESSNDHDKYLWYRYNCCLHLNCPKQAKFSFVNNSWNVAFQFEHSKISAPYIGI
jgi:hypothetical protein